MIAMNNEQYKEDIASLSNAELLELERAIERRIDDAKLSYKSYRDALAEVASEYLDCVRSEKAKRGLLPVLETPGGNNG